VIVDDTHWYISAGGVASAQREYPRVTEASLQLQPVVPRAWAGCSLLHLDEHENRGTSLLGAPRESREPSERSEAMVDDAGCLLVPSVRSVVPSKAGGARRLDVLLLGQVAAGAQHE
jgi:hypothetical protein